MLEPLRQAGGQYAYFFPPMFKYLNMKLNYRNHRKLVVIDGSIGNPIGPFENYFSKLCPACNFRFFLPFNGMAI
jgi:hypothetical protein